ncbi:MAG: hypothetical protein ACI4RT_06450 [Candidatus Spyradenecus sp.]
MIVNLAKASAIGALACGVSLLLTPLVRGLMRRLGAVDQPDPRRVNRVPVPRGGGLAVVAAVLVALAAAWGLWPEAMAAQPFSKVQWPYLASTGLLVAVGAVDDRWGLPAKVKLLAQVVVSCVMCWGGARLILPSALGAWVALPWVYVPLTVAWYIGVINAFNLIDGLDGLSSGLAIIGTLGMIGATLVTTPTLLPVASFAFIGALLGFLRYNYNPASVFLGDSGSLFVGLTLATFALVSRRGDAFLATMGLSILCVGVPLIDTSLAILRRTLRYILARGEAVQTEGAGGETSAVMTADRDHVHHRFLQWAQGNQRLAVGGLYALASALVLLGFATLFLRAGNATVFLLGFLLVAAVILRAMTNVEFWDAGRLLAKPGARNGRRAIAVPLYVVADIVVMWGLFHALRWLLASTLPALNCVAWLNILLAYAVPVIAGLVLVRAYDRIWGRSTRKDSLALFLAVLVASGISHLGIVYLCPTLAKPLLRFHLFYALLLPTPLIVLRLVKTAFLQCIAVAENDRLKRASAQDATIERVLFYGAGVNLRAYITLYEVNVTRNRVAMIGVLDDNPGLRGRIFRDLPIFGPLEVLESDRLFRRLHPTRIILTTPAIGPERLADIERFCQARGMALSRCTIAEQELLSHTPSAAL